MSQPGNKTSENLTEEERCRQIRSEEKEQGREMEEALAVMERCLVENGIYGIDPQFFFMHELQA